MFRTIIYFLVFMSISPVYGEGSESYAFSYQEAYQIAYAQQKYIFVFLHSNNCEPCRKMETNTLSDPVVNKALLDRYVIANVNVSEEVGYAELLKFIAIMEKYTGQNWNLVPQYYIIAVEKEKKTIVRWGYGYKDVPKFWKWLVGNEN